MEVMAYRNDRCRIVLSGTAAFEESRVIGLRDYHGPQSARCWCGGTGRRGDLSDLWAKARAGSSPATSTAAHGGLTAIAHLFIVEALRGLSGVSPNARKAEELTLLGFRFLERRRSPDPARKTASAPRTTPHCCAADPGVA